MISNQVDGPPTKFIFGIHIGSYLKQRRHCGQTAMSDGCVQWRAAMIHFARKVQVRIAMFGLVPEQLRVVADSGPMEWTAATAIMWLTLDPKSIRAFVFSKYISAQNLCKAMPPI